MPGRTPRKSGAKIATKAPARGRKTRGKLAPGAHKRGLSADQIVLEPDAPELASLRQQVSGAGGAAVGAYREPLSGRPVLLAALPLEAVAPTPFQRDLSPTHTQRLAAKIEESGSFLDPLIVVRGDDGRLWTPNGRHRLAAAKMLGLKQIMALVSPDESLAFRILALNTEKAHNLKDRALEVIRMARTLAKRDPRAKEARFAAEFEAPELLTLGIVYERNARFGGGAYNSFLKKVDRFDSRTLPVSLRFREDWAARIEQIDAQVGRIVEALHARGMKSPYLRNYVVARINPVRFVRAKKGDTGAAMPIAQALTRMAAAAAKFDLASVSASDVALVAAAVAEPA
ncbi:MAG TPA: ParB/RepB/Spo0J family partition protein [Burkholderiaceae bacterium]|nr:ParB/RepB/Spo0J family partition protein [Burkholderiaceae bacterium]